MTPAIDVPDDRALHLTAARTSLVCALTVTAAGAAVLYGWAWNVESFKTIYGPITMKTNTAIGLVLCGTSLAGLRWFPRVSMFCAVCAAIIGAGTLSEHFIGWDLRIDQLLFSEAPGAAGTSSPNRMGLTASFSLVLAGNSLYRLNKSDSRGVAVAQTLAALALTLAAVPLAGYLYGAEELYGIAQYTGIALHTAVALFILNVGILTARVSLGPVAVFVNEGPAGTMVRGLAIPVVGIPLALGYLVIYGGGAQIVDRGLGIALYAVALIVVLGVTVWYTARAIERSDRARRRAEVDRDSLIVSERQARAEAERASQLKDQFLATLSHELRTPLNAMLGWTRILEVGANPQDHLRIAGRVAKNGRQLARLVEDLLDLSRVTAGQFEISRAPTSLNAVVQSSLETVMPAANAKGVEVAADLDVQMEPIDADAQRLIQVVCNLLSNALKFTDAGGRVVARTSSTADAAVLTISDNGRGFDETFAAEIFKPFRQADPSLSREHGGLGLGLSIARHLAELHGGSLTGSSPGIGGGATFTLTLPRPRPVAGAATPAREAAPVKGAGVAAGIVRS